VRSVLRSAPDPSAVVDRESGSVVDGSTSFVKQFGDIGASRPLTEIVQFSQPERIELLLARGSGTAWQSVYYNGGTSRVANVRCYPVEHEGGSYAYVVMEDVTEQHYLKASFDAVADAVLVISADQRLLYANRAAEALFGQLYFGDEVGPLLARPELGPEWGPKATAR